MDAHFGITSPPLVQRGHSVLTPRGWIVWRPIDVEYRPLGPEWIWRGLRDVDLTDEAQVLAVLDRVGMIFGTFEDLRDDNTTPAETPYPSRPMIDSDGPVQNHIVDAVAYLETLRKLADLWAAYAEGTTAGLPKAFDHALGVGLRPFTLHIEVKAALFPVQNPPIVDLYEAGCWQLAQTILVSPDVKRCGNENCRRVFFQRDPGAARGWATERAKYCSDACKNAQLTRKYRARERRRVPLA